MIFEFPTAQTDHKPSSAEQSKRPTPKHEFEDHENTVSSFVFLHDNVHIVSGSWGGTMRKWDCETGLLVGEPWEGQGGRIYALALSPNGETIACARDGSVERWNTDGEMIEGIWMGHSSSVGSLSWSPSGDHIASGSLHGTILIQKAESRQVKVGPIETKQGWVRSLAYSPAPLGDRIASGGDDSICIWDSRTGNLLVGPIEHLGFWVKSVVWSSDGSKLYSTDKFVRVFDSIEGTELLRLQHHYSPRCVALSPRHNLLACVGYGGIAQLWNTQSNQPLGQPLFHRNELRHVSFSPDARCLAYCGDDHRIILWLVRDIAPEIESSPSCFEIDTTKPFTGTEDRDNIYEMNVHAPGVVPKNNEQPNAQATTSSAMQQSSAPRHPQSQPVTQLAEEEYDLGCWGNFWYAICCMRPRPRQTVPAVQSAAS